MASVARFTRVTHAPFGVRMAVVTGNVDDDITADCGIAATNVNDDITTTITTTTTTTITVAYDRDIITTTTIAADRVIITANVKNTITTATTTTTTTTTTTDVAVVDDIVGMTNNFVATFVEHANHISRQSVAWHFGAHHQSQPVSTHERLCQVLVKAIVHQPPVRACHVQSHGWFGWFGLVGLVCFVWFVLVGLVCLVGLVGKNGLLIGRCSTTNLPAWFRLEFCAKHW